MSRDYDHNSSDEDLSKVFEGRKIVHAEKGGEYPRMGYSVPEGLLVLDDGTKLYLAGNDGGCACSAGCYPLAHVATVDNIITRAEIYSSPDTDDDERGEGVYRIFVFADAEKINVAEFQGSDGNGYYGTGFELIVVRPGEED